MAPGKWRPRGVRLAQHNRPSQTIAPFTTSNLDSTPDHSAATHQALRVWRLAFGVWRSAFGVWRSAFGVRRLVLVLECSCLPKRSANPIRSAFPELHPASAGLEVLSGRSCGRYNPGLICFTISWWAFSAPSISPRPPDHALCMPVYQRDVLQ